MPTITIHGFELEAAEFSSKDLLYGLERSRSQDATARQTYIDDKLEISIAMPLADPSVVGPIISLTKGQGHVWSFDADVFSSKGLGWTATQPTRDTTNMKFGAASGAVASAATVTAAYTEATTRTVFYWRRPNSGSFNHYALVLTGATVTSKFKNGVTTAETVTNWFTANADGSFALLGKDDAGANSIAQYDDLVVVPFVATTAMITAWSAGTRAWADLPKLNMSGDLIPDVAGVSKNIEALTEPVATKWEKGVSPTDSVFKPLAAYSFNAFEV